MVLAAVHAVADAHAVWTSRSFEPDLAAQTTASELSHDVFLVAVGVAVRPNVRVNRPAEASAVSPD